MTRSKEQKREKSFLYQGNRQLVCKAIGVEAALALKNPNRFLKQFRDSNRSRVA